MEQYNGPLHRAKMYVAAGLTAVTLGLATLGFGPKANASFVPNQGYVLTATTIPLQYSPTPANDLGILPTPTPTPNGLESLVQVTPVSAVIVDEAQYSTLEAGSIRLFYSNGDEQRNAFRQTSGGLLLVSDSPNNRESYSVSLEISLELINNPNYLGNRNFVLQFLKPDGSTLTYEGKGEYLDGKYIVNFPNVVFPTNAEGTLYEDRNGIWLPIASFSTYAQKSGVRRPTPTAQPTNSPVITQSTDNSAGNPGESPETGGSSGGLPPTQQPPTQQPTQEPTPSCFLRGTKILMSNNTLKNIESVRVNESVVSYDIKNKKRVIKKVLKLEKHDDTKYYFVVKLSNGVIIKLTGEHPVFTKKGWASIENDLTYKYQKLNATKLEVGSKVLTNKGKWVSVKSIKRINRKVKTYNLREIQDTHTFYANSILVHNKGGDDDDIGSGDG